MELSAMPDLRILKVLDLSFNRLFRLEELLHELEELPQLEVRKLVTQIVTIALIAKYLQGS